MIPKEERRAARMAFAVGALLSSTEVGGNYGTAKDRRFQMQSHHQLGLQLIARPAAVAGDVVLVEVCNGEDM